MNNSRYEVEVTIGGKSYPMCYTNAAVIKVMRINEKVDIKTLPKSELIRITIMIARIFINGAIAAHNMETGSNDEPITDEMIELLASPDELKALVDAVNAVKGGTNRDVRTENEAEDAKKADAE